jgi:hypothetical protein
MSSREEMPKKAFSAKFKEDEKNHLVAIMWKDT